MMGSYVHIFRQGLHVGRRMLQQDMYGPMPLVVRSLRGTR